MDTDTIWYVDLDDPTDEYFSAAFALKSESAHAQGRRAHQSLILSCISSFLSLEAAINRLYYDTFERGDPSKKRVRKGIPSNIVKHIKQSWKRLPVRHKFLLLPPLISTYEFVPDEKPFNLFDELVRFRNQLVHAETSEERRPFRLGDPGFSPHKAETEVDPSIRKALFPLTHFASSLRYVASEDADKAFEIAYRMRMELHTKVKAPPPRLLLISNSTEEQVLKAHSIAERIKLRFGELTVSVD